MGEPDYKPTVVEKQIGKTRTVVFADGLDLGVNKIQFIDVTRKLTSYKIEVLNAIFYLLCGIVYTFVCVFSNKN